MNNDNELKQSVFDVAMRLKEQFLGAKDKFDAIMYHEAYLYLQNVIIARNWQKEFDEYVNKHSSQIVEKGTMIFSFDFEVCAPTQEQIDKAINKMIDFWYDNQEGNLRDDLKCDFMDNTISLNIQNARVRVDDARISVKKIIDK